MWNKEKAEHEVGQVEKKFTESVELLGRTCPKKDFACMVKGFAAYFPRWMGREL